MSENTIGTVKDSGQRQEFPTGARRDTQDGKGRFDLLPTIAIRDLAKLMEAGAKKYGEHNYLRGIPASRFFDSALRHLFKALEGHTDEPHLLQCAFNVLGLYQTREMIRLGLLPKELDDVPSRVPEGSVESQYAAAQQRLFAAQAEIDRLAVEL